MSLLWTDSLALMCLSQTNVKICTSHSTARSDRGRGRTIGIAAMLRSTDRLIMLQFPAVVTGYSVVKSVQKVLGSQSVSS
jgi:hypothetical protein